MTLQWQLSNLKLTQQNNYQSKRCQYVLCAWEKGCTSFSKLVCFSSLDVYHTAKGSSENGLHGERLIGSACVCRMGVYKHYLEYWSDKVTSSQAPYVHWFSLCGGQVLHCRVRDIMVLFLLQREKECVTSYSCHWWKQNLLASFPGLPTMWSGYEARYKQCTLKS